jgi:hypothetical protein
MIRGGVVFGLAALILTGCGPETWSDLDPHQLGWQTSGLHAVWVRDKQGTPSTYFLDELGDAVAVEDGVVLRTPAGELRWSKQRVPIKTYPCDLFPGTLPPDDGAYERVSLVPRSGAPIPVAPLDVRDLEASGWINTYSNELKLLGSVGSLLFLHREAYVFGCGAHGNVATETFVWNLTTGRAVDLEPELSPADLRRALDAAPPLLTEVVKVDGEVVMEEHRPGLDELRLTGLIPRHAADGLRLDYQITADTSYVMTRGGGDSYTRSTLIAAGQLPSSLAGCRRLPAAVARFARSRSELTIGGYSTF